MWQAGGRDNGLDCISHHCLVSRLPQPGLPLCERGVAMQGMVKPPMGPSRASSEHTLTHQTQEPINGVRKRAVGSMSDFSKVRVLGPPKARQPQ